MHDLYQFFVHVAYGCDFDLLQQGDDIPRGMGNFVGYPGHSKALAIFAAAIAATFAAKGIIQYARQVQIGIQEFLSTGNAAYRLGG